MRIRCGDGVVTAEFGGRFTPRDCSLAETGGIRPYLLVSRCSRGTAECLIPFLSIPSHRPALERRPAAVGEYPIVCGTQSS